MLRDVIASLRDRAGTIDDSAGAAVAILLKDDEGDLQVLLVKRATSPSDPWSGHMAFPGGRRTPVDADLRETAMRETMEETGINLSECTQIGILGPFKSTVAPDMNVLPFVFACEGTPKINLNEELCAYYWASLDELRKSEGKADISLGDVPSYLVAGEVIWGLTYRMLEQFFRLI